MYPVGGPADTSLPNIQQTEDFIHLFCASVDRWSCHKTGVSASVLSLWCDALRYFVHFIQSLMRYKPLNGCEDGHIRLLQKFEPLIGSDPFVILCGPA